MSAQRQKPIDFAAEGLRLALSFDRNCRIRVQSLSTANPYASPLLHPREIPAVAPKAFGGGVKRYNQRGIRCIAAHAFERKGTLALPGDPVLAGLDGPAESRDEIVGGVRTSENGPPAEVQAHDVGW